MRQGRFQDGHPRLSLELPGIDELVTVEFVVDTGFEGGLSLPRDLVRQLDVVPAGLRNRSLADGSPVRCIAYEILLEDPEGDDEQAIFEILEIEGRPLVGTDFFRDQLLQIEVFEGGEVNAERL